MTTKNSSASRMFDQLFVQTDIKGYIKAPHHWSIVKGIHQVSLNDDPTKPRWILIKFLL